MTTLTESVKLSYATRMKIKGREVTQMFAKNIICSAFIATAGIPLGLRHTRDKYYKFHGFPLGLNQKLRISN